MPQLTVHSSSSSVRRAVAEILREGAAVRGTHVSIAARAGCAAVMIALGGTAIAQQAPAKPQTAAIGSGNAAAAQGEAAAEGTLDEVVVTGIRRGIENAIEVKRDSSSIVEAISAEDIGKLPDQSIADSLSRLPGLTSQRAEGRSSAISLRGTDPGFTSTLLNGREQVSTGDNRNVEFDQYPSELLSAAIVYKTPDANLVGQGLAGTVDLRTQRPLAYGRRAVVMNIRGEKNSQGDLGADSTDTGYRVSFSYIDQFMDNRLGFTFGAAYLDQPLATRAVGMYEPWHPNSRASDDFNFQPQLPVGVYVTNGMKARVDMGTNKRFGTMAALEFKPNDSYTGVLDVYYTKRKQEDNARSLEVNLGNYPTPCCDGPGGNSGNWGNTVVGYTNPVIVDNSVVGGNSTYRVPLARNFLFKTDDEIFAAGLNNKFTRGEWQYTLDIGYSKATRDEEQYETNSQYLPRSNPGPTQTRNITDTLTFNIPKTSMPTMSFLLNYADPNLVQIGPTIYGSGYTKIPHVEDELTSARFDVDRTLEWGWFDGMSAGINYSDRTKDKVQPENDLFLLPSPTGYFKIDPQYLEDPTNLSYAGAGQALAWDVKGVLGAYFKPITYLGPNDKNYLAGKAWKVEEKVTTGYLRATLNQDLGQDVMLRGNVGVQIVDTDQSSDANAWDNVNNRAVPFSNSKSYTDVLPSLNFVFAMPGEQAVRFAWSKQLARARMDQLKASSEFGWDKATGRPSGSGGNTKLDPWRANALDLSYEKYFAGNKGYVSIAGFYKDLKSYIYNQTDQTFDFSGVLAQTTFPPGYFPPGVTPKAVGSFTQPVNGSGGSLQGAELAVSLPVELFSDSLRGFGVILSYSYTDSGIQIKDIGGTTFLTGNNLGTIPLPGLSKTVWNATAYYENYGFSARIATRYRSKYIGEVTNFANERATKYVHDEQITDAQLGYAFSGRLDGLSLLLQVNNLTNEPYIAYAASTTRVLDYQEYGRQYLLGFNYRL